MIREDLSLLLEERENKIYIKGKPFDYMFAREIGISPVEAIIFDCEETYIGQLLDKGKIRISSLEELRAREEAVLDRSIIQSYFFKHPLTETEISWIRESFKNFIHRNQINSLEISEFNYSVERSCILTKDNFSDFSNDRDFKIDFGRFLSRLNEKIPIRSINGQNISAILSQF